jgi:hypothetical protein
MVEAFGANSSEESRGRVYWHNNIRSWIESKHNSGTMADTYQAMEEEGAK